VRIDEVYGSRLVLDVASIPVLQIAAHETKTLAELAPTVEGKADPTRIDQITLEEIGRRNRMQTIAFKAAAEVFDQMKPGWPGSREVLLGQLVALVDEFLRSDRIAILPALFASDPLRRRILLTLNMTRIVHHMREAIRVTDLREHKLVLDRERPIRSTADMQPWYTAKPCGTTVRSHVNFCVFDSTWEASEAFALDRDPRVAAWVKNDHLGFEVHYLSDGVVRRYRPDFLIKFDTGLRLILETKGQDTPRDRAKRAALAEWVAAVNEHGGFGRWACDVSFSPSDLPDILARH
jgi:type III restriction enzyme